PDPFHLQLRKQADVGTRAPVLLGVALLSPATLDLGDVQPAGAELVQSVLNWLKALVPDDCFDLFHLSLLVAQGPNPIGGIILVWAPGGLRPRPARAVAPAAGREARAGDTRSRA